MPAQYARKTADIYVQYPQLPLLYIKARRLSRNFLKSLENFGKLI